MEATRENDVHIVFSTDDNYIKYLAIAIYSLETHITSANKYNIYILNYGISEQNRNKIKFLITKNNINIEFIDISKYLANIENKILYTRLHFTPAIYYRFFISNIFAIYKKVIYCDCDIVFKNDIAKLWQIDLKNNYIAAVKDISVRKESFSNKTKIKNYYTEILKLKNPRNYFNSGILIFNIEQLKSVNFSELCISVLQQLKTPRYPDQDVLNILCEDKVLFLDYKWNVLNHILVEHPDIIKYLCNNEKENFVNAYNSPSILHFSSPIKPWQNPCICNAEHFWFYAQKTTFYEEIIYSNIIEKVSLINKKEHFYSNVFEYIFSIKNDDIYKIITLLGIKIKLLRRTKSE